MCCFRATNPPLAFFKISVERDSTSFVRHLSDVRDDPPKRRPVSMHKSVLTQQGIRMSRCAALPVEDLVLGCCAAGGVTEEDFLKNLHTAAESLQKALPRVLDHVVGMDLDTLLR